MSNVSGKVCFSKRVNKWAKHGFATKSLSRKEAHRLFVKEKVPVAMFSKD